jgi:hypothetical protein
VTDSIRYLNGGINLVYGHGVSLRTYDIGADEIIYERITHHAPLLSVGYALLIWLGIPFAHVPTVFALLNWVLLLSGMGVFTYRFCQQPLAAAMVVITASVTFSFLTIYTIAFSEVLFLPLLIWSMVVLLDLHQRERGVLLWLGGAAVLLALMTLTRLVGGVLLAAVLLWWAWGRLYQGQLKRLIWEMPVLGLAGLPLGVLILINSTQTEEAVGWHFEESNHTFLDGVKSLVLHLSQVLIPAWPSLQAVLDGNMWGWYLEAGPVRWFVLLSPWLVFALLGYVLWRFRPQRPHLLALPRSPILFCLAAYLALYTIVQPFMKFTPIDNRDITTVLCLMLPWLLGSLVLTFGWRAYIPLTGYVLLNVALVAVPIAMHARPLFTVNPLSVADFAHEPAQRSFYADQGVPTWLISTPRKIRTLERYHPQLFALLQQFDDVALINRRLEPNVYTVNLQGRDDPPLYFNYSFSFDHWLAEGTCTPSAATLVVALLDWNFGSREFRANVAAVAQKCPEAPQMPTTHGVAYRLDQTIPTYEQGLAYAEQGEWQRAIEIYDAALAFNPDNVRAYADRGTAYMELQQWEQAIADFDQAIALMPGWPQPYRLRGEAYAAIGDTEQRQADFDKAAALEQAIQESEVGQRNDPTD